MFLIFAELHIKKEIFKEQTDEGSSTKPHGDAESIDYYAPNTLNFIVKIGHKYFKTIKHTTTVLYVVVHVKPIRLPLQEAVG